MSSKVQGAEYTAARVGPQQQQQRQVGLVTPAAASVAAAAAPSAAAAAAVAAAVRIQRKHMQARIEHPPREVDRPQRPLHCQLLVAAVVVPLAWVEVVLLQEREAETASGRQVGVESDVTK